MNVPQHIPLSSHIVSEKFESVYKYISCLFLCACVWCIVVVVIPRSSGTAPADMGTPQWITHGRGGFTEEEKEINGGRYSTKGGKAKGFLNTISWYLHRHRQRGGNSLRLPF